MRTSAALIVPAALVLLAGAGAPARTAPANAAGSGYSAERAREVRRIRAHFDSVITELAARDVAALTAAQRSRRAGVTATLQAYRDRGEFPHNYDFPGRAVPYFVDRETGTLCAVAHLLATSGRRDIVDRVARANNNVYVAELAGDTAFTRWLDGAGVTLEEAARIQVPYVGPDPERALQPTSATTRSVYTAGSALTIGGSLAASLWNARANASGGRRLGTVLGMTAGAAAIGLGAVTLGDRSVSPTLGAANMAAGAASAWIATRGMLRHRRLDARTAAPRTAVAPIVAPDGQSGAGVAVKMQF